MRFFLLDLLGEAAGLAVCAIGGAAVVALPHVATVSAYGSRTEHQ